MSKNIKFSPAQQEVISAPISDVLVSAAAGSGKTTVLVGRIVEELVRGELSIDEVLVMTFTKDAAEHMRIKLRDALSERIKILRKSGSSESLKLASDLNEQLDKLPNAYIQTINSFCTRVIKEKGYLIGDSDKDNVLEPDLTIIDDNELDIILSNAADRAVNESYSDRTDNFIKLTEMFGDGRTDASLKDSLTESYKKLRSLPDYIELTDEIIRRRKKCDESCQVIGSDIAVSEIRPLFDKLSPENISSLITLVGGLVFVKSGNNKRQELFIELCERIGDYSSKIRHLYENNADPEAIIEALFDCNDIANDALHGKEKLYSPINKLAEYNDSVDVMKFETLFAPIATLVDILKEELGISKNPSGYKEVRVLAGIPEGAVKFIRNMSPNNGGIRHALELQRNRTEVIEAYAVLIEKTDRIYSALKQRIRGMDFSDQEHIAAGILKNPEASEYYRDRFKEIYIDEYQDNSRLQDHIISLIERDGDGNVFRVGDVKQSIYRFRNAEPEMFMDKLEKYSGDSNRLKLLNCNYRSSISILRFVNDIFAQLMTREGARIEYDESQSLKWDEETAVQGEAPRVVIVDSRKDMLDDGSDLNDTLCLEQGVLHQVADYCKRHEGVDREELLSGICILTRKRKMAGAIAAYLNDSGFPAMYIDELSIFDDHDIHGLCNILIGLGNELRDEYILGILLSGYRISNFTVDELARIEVFCKNRGTADLNLIQRLRDFNENNISSGDAEIRDRVSKFLDWFDDLRSDMVITDIGELISRIYKDTGILASNKDSVSKFVLFKQWLCSAYMKYGSDISSIADSLEDMKIKLKGGSAVRNAMDVTGRIKCMTYHSSKGLEFPYVIVTVANEKSKPDKSGAISFDPEFGFTADDYDTKAITRLNSGERLLLNDHLKLNGNAEDMRLLYVALTRAMRELSVVAAVPLDGGDDSYTSQSSDSALATLYRLAGKNEGLQYTKSFWAGVAGNLYTDFMAGIVRSSKAAPLDRTLKRLFIKNGDDCREYNDQAQAIESFEMILLRPTPADTAVGINEAEGDSEDESVDDVYVEKEGNAQMIPVCAAGYTADGMPVFAPYPYEESSRTPFKVAVSQIKDGKVNDVLPINLEIRDFAFFMAKQNGESGETAADVGTFVHRLFRFIDMEDIANSEDGFAKQIDELVAEGIIREDDRNRAMEFEYGIKAFARSDIGKASVKASDNNMAEYEKPIVFAVHTQKEDCALVQGIIDLTFKVGDETYVVDYKTDRLADCATIDERAEEARKRHSMQIDLYSAALSVSGHKVIHKYIYLVRFGEFVRVR